MTGAMECGVKGKGGVREGRPLRGGKRSGGVGLERSGGRGGGEAAQSQPAAAPAPKSAEASRIEGSF